jgi:hypothetical protein
MVGPFIFRCPATGLKVQHIFGDEAPETGHDRAYVLAVIRVETQWTSIATPLVETQAAGWPAPTRWLK